MARSRREPLNQNRKFRARRLARIRRRHRRRTATAVVRHAGGRANGRVPGGTFSSRAWRQRRNGTESVPKAQENGEGVQDAPRNGFAIRASLAQSARTRGRQGSVRACSKDLRGLESQRRPWVGNRVIPLRVEQVVGARREGTPQRVQALGGIVLCSFKDATKLGVSCGKHPTPLNFIN